MKSLSKDNYKKHSEIFNLKKILNNANNESNLLKEKIKELQKIFKSMKNIINYFCTYENNGKINILSKNKVDNKNQNIKEIKQNICNAINNIIKEYKEGNENTSIKKKIEEYEKLIKDKINKVNKLLIKLKYEKIIKEKDMLIQTIKEKKNICDSFNNQIELEQDFHNAFQPKNYIFYDNLYNINIENAEIKQIIDKNKKLKNLLDKTKIYLKEKGEKSIKYLKEEKINYIQKLNDFINDKGFNYSFSNKRYKVKYNIKIELINNYGYSSDSDSDSKEEESNNKIDFIHYLNKNKFDKLKIKKISLSSSEKDTNDQDIKNSSNYILLNKLVDLKQKYNKLINEKYELDYKKNAIIKNIKNIKNIKKNIKNIKNIKYSIKRNNAFSSTKKRNKLYYY